MFRWNLTRNCKCFKKRESKVDSIVTLAAAYKDAKEYLTLVGENSNSDWQKASLEEGKPLYDFDGNITSYVFEVQNGVEEEGYIIVSAHSAFPGVLESTRVGHSPYVGITGKDAVYVGPLLHYKKSGYDEFIDLKSNKKAKKGNLKSKGFFTKEKMQAEVEKKSQVVKDNEQLMSTQSISDYSYKLISNVPDYSRYIGCAPTSGANIIAYWDYYYPNINNSSSSTLISTLASYMNTNSSGDTTVSNMASGMRNYITSRGYSATVATYSGSFARHVTEIKANSPSWVTTENHPIWGDHAMTGVGYEEYYSYDDLRWYQQAILHDTWSSTPKDYWVQWSSYFDYVIKVRPY